MQTPKPRLRWFLMELTYACPLRCSYCSNPLEFAKVQAELSTDDWLRVLDEARALGASQLGISGGEPLVRRDLEVIVAHARGLGFYINLITSGMGLYDKRLAALQEAGVDNIQISFQAASQRLNDQLAGLQVFAKKRQVAAAIRAAGYPLGLNFVIHRQNIDHLEAMLQLALDLQADYVELANAQYYGFALLNRDLLLPSRVQIANAAALVRTYQERHGAHTKFLYVVPDYFEGRPKPCMNGWGEVFMVVAPDGKALPCHSARAITTLTYPNVRAHDLRWIWEDSPSFTIFRGNDWMQDPCRSCPERVKDFAGCRCQAFLLTGDARAADPACSLSPHHHLMEAAIEAAESAAADGKQRLVARTVKQSRAPFTDNTP